VRAQTNHDGHSDWFLLHWISMVQKHDKVPLKDCRTPPIDDRDNVIIDYFYDKKYLTMVSAITCKHNCFQ
jgi:hypothetical protein